MLKKTIVASTIVLGLSLSGLAQAAPLSWTPGPGLIAELSRWWDLLPGGQQAAASRSAWDSTKNGCGIDPNDSQLCAPKPASGRTPAAPHAGAPARRTAG
ncbi:MAG TPA: hypothetical protein VGG20_05630 [Thermoanaerobaculia bacterium]|jgi:hypothetical protein